MAGRALPLLASMYAYVPKRTVQSTGGSVLGSTVRIRTPASQTRRDLFGEQAKLPSGSRNPAMIPNAAYEVSPRQERTPSPRRPAWNSGTQSYVRAVISPVQGRPVQLLRDRSRSPPNRSTGDIQLHHTTVADSQSEEIPDPTVLPAASQPVQDESLDPDPDPTVLPQASQPVQDESLNPEGNADLQGDEDLQDAFSEDDLDTDEEGFCLSERDETKLLNREYRDNRKWRKRVMKEVADAFRLLPDHTGEADEDATEVEHTFDFDAQIRLQAQKRRGEDCGVVFCTVDMSPSRDAFTQWVYQEVENKAAVQISHIKVLAHRHYLVLTRNLEDRDAILTGGPYYMKRRMVYTTPWSPGFDTTKILSKKMACWLDLINVDHFMEGESENLLSSLGHVLQMAGVNDKGEGKFQNIRGCVLMDMSKPLPQVLKLKMNGIYKRIAIKYDTLPDACYSCQERGHFAKSCPLRTKPTTVAATVEAENNESDEEGFVPVGKGGRPAKDQQNGERVSGPSNPYALLAETSEGSDAEQEALGGDSQESEKKSTPQSVPAQGGNVSEASKGSGKDPTAQEVAANEVSGQRASAAAKPLPDLNNQPASSENSLSTKEQEKIRRKERKKAKKLAARMRRAGVGSQSVDSLPSKSQNSAEAGYESDTSQESSEAEGTGMWRTSGDKRQKGDLNTMDMGAGWADTTEN
ncbi:hypothetical protein R1sor_017528 [Riccia sorocarpa]|uniref:CCHC-type domain-containing protein n=1 Tax=Riccia sorocarpa TaxID=122646 RepID=A0ABD3IB49_9MARC